MGTPLGPEPIAERREGRIKPGIQHLENSLLHETIHDRRNPQLADSTTRLGDGDPSHRGRPVTAVSQRGRQRNLVDLQPILKCLHRHGVTAWRTAIRPHALVRVAQIDRTAHLLHQVLCGQGW